MRSKSLKICYDAPRRMNDPYEITRMDRSMPLKKGSSKTTRNKNIKEVIDSYESTGKIGKSKPKSKKKAIAQAVAIGYAEQRRSKRKGR